MDGLMSDKDTLAEALEHFKLSEEAESENRKAWIDDVRFARLGEQWPDGVKRQREIDGRPCLTINRLPAMLRQVVNDARQNKPAIKVHPVDSGAKRETAEILNGLIRNIEYTSNADVAYDTALDHAVTGGFGYFRIDVDYACDDEFDLDIKICRIANPLTVYGDENSTAADSSDWNKAFITELYTESEFEKRWKGAEKSNWESSYRDLPDGWRDNELVRVAEWWTREEVPAKLLKLSDGMVLYVNEYMRIKDILDAQGITVVGERDTKTNKVKQKIISGAEVLEENEWAGKYIPIVPVYGDEVMVEGKRHWISLTRWAKDPQQMFNYWRTASTELVALAPKAPYLGPKGAFNTDANKWATANNVSYPYIEYDGAVMPQRQPFAGPPAGALQEALNASDDMKSTMGIYDAALGARSNETSGRAILQRQRESDTATFNYIDNLSRAIRHAGRVMVDLIPKVYNAPRIIRVIHEDGSNESVPINQPFTPDQAKSPQAQAYEAGKTQETVDGLTRIYDVTTGKYDVTCEAGPSFSTKREEAAAQMIELGRMFPPMMQVAGDLLVKNLDWPGADDIADRLKAMLPPQLQGQSPQVMQMRQQMQQMDQMAKQAVGQLNQQIAQLQQQLQQEKSHDAQAMLQADIDRKKLEIDEYNAVTNRMKVTAPAMTPQDIQMLVVQTLRQALEAPQTEQQPPPGGFFMPGEQPPPAMPQG
ncbi:MAG TPA: portal protein [Giesbergeria sp.]|nr:portal protein [Giesbergeria sp.]